MCKGNCGKCKKAEFETTDLQVESLDQRSRMFIVDGWFDVKEFPVNGNHNWKVGDKAIAFGGYVFEIEWDGEHWCSIGGDDFTHWMRYSEPK